MAGGLMTRSPMKNKNDVGKKTTLCGAVLKYISRVLMEDDDSEDETNVIDESRLISTKRSFQEVIFSHEESDGLSGERKRKYSVEEDGVLISEMFSKMGIMYGKNDNFFSTAHQTALLKVMFCKREGLDLRKLLLNCRQFVSLSDHNNGNKLLKEIKSRTNNNGDGTQRVAHYFGQGLEARLTGTRVNNHKIPAVKIYSDNDILKAFKLYLTTLPFSETPYFFANQTIMELAKNICRGGRPLVD